MNPNQLNENEKFLGRRKSKITKISDKTIESLKDELNWDGNGSKFEPILIENLGSLPLSLKIYKNSLYCNIKNLTINELICRNTQNITIENCTINQLEIHGCYNLTLVNNNILKHRIAFTKGSNFIDNKIAQIEKFKQNLNATQVNPLGRQFMSPITCCLCLTAVSIFIADPPLWFFGFIPIGVLFFLNYSTYAKLRRIEDKPDNIYANNVEL